MTDQIDDHELRMEYHDHVGVAGWTLHVDGGDDIAIGPSTDDVDVTELPDVDRARELAADELGGDPEDVAVAS